MDFTKYNCLVCGQKFKDTDDEPFAEFDEQERRNTLGEGLFWVF